MKKVLTLLFSTITIFALVSCNDVDTSSTTSVVTPSSSIITPSSYSDTSSIETSSIEVTSSVEESSSIEVSSSIIEESSSEETSSTIEQSSSDVQEPSSDIESSSSDESSSESSIQVTYHVRFVNYDDSLLYETDVNEGSDVIYDGQTPKRSADDDYTYSFKGWDKELTNITSDMTIKATYNSQQIQWGSIDWDF